MCRAIAMYPTAKIIRTTATAIMAIETPVRPVTARPVVTTPATTVSGATEDAIAMPMPGAPSRSRARAVETVLSRRTDRVLGTGDSFGQCGGGRVFCEGTRGCCLSVHHGLADS